jgi:alpha-galactosidase
MYLPYFRRKPALAERYRLDDYGPIFGGAPKRTADETEELKQQIASGYQFPFIEEYRWSKHAADVMDSMETGFVRRIDGNVKNKGLITNLLEGCCVEVPCLVDKDGVHPCYVGDLPPQCATLNRTNIGEQELAVRGIVEKDKKKILQAMLIDPLASSLMTIDECRDMVDEMFKIDKPFLKGFK